MAFTELELKKIRKSSLLEKEAKDSSGPSPVRSTESLSILN